MSVSPACRFRSAFCSPTSMPICPCPGIPSTSGSPG
jgi:hypothetical protein